MSPENVRILTRRPATERRRSPRTALQMMATVQLHGEPLHGLVENASPQGVLFSTYAQTPSLAVGDRVELTLEPCRARVEVRRDAQVVRVEVRISDRRERFFYAMHLSDPLPVDEILRDERG